MTPETSSGSTLQVCRECGGGAPVDVHFCPQCEKILALGRNGNYFAFLGLARRLALDPADLEQRFRALSRRFHPDYFCNASAAERRASLERSSYLNDAYRTLRQPVSRIEYLLRLEGVASASRAAGATQVPPALLEEVFALNEELEMIRELRAGGAAPEIWRRRLEAARAPIDLKLAAHEAELRGLSARWDALADAGAPPAERRIVLEALRDRLLERNYITNLLGVIERELSE
jgi:molecular chaperone HscB